MNLQLVVGEDIHPGLVRQGLEVAVQVDGPNVGGGPKDPEQATVGAVPSQAQVFQLGIRN